MVRIILPKNIDVVVASVGGAGSTILLSYLANYKTTNRLGDKDGLKHSPLPPVSFNTDIKFVYVFRKPQAVVISLFRRNIQRAQSKKLQRWVNEYCSPIPKDMTLQEYASIGVDRLFFKNHFFNWYDRYLTAIPTMFIRYETMFDNVEPLLDFLDIPLDHKDNFPKKKKRSTTIEEIPAETVNQLDKMYGDFSGELAKLDDIEIRQNKNRKIISMSHLTTPYLRAVAEQVAYDQKNLLKDHSPRIYTMLRNIKRLTIR